MTEIKQPKLRFSGFTDPWEQRKFESLFRKSRIKNIHLKYSESDILSVASMEPSANHRHSSDEYMKSYNVIYINDIAFEGHTSKEFKFGRFVMNDRQDGIVSHVFDVFRPITKLSPKFIKYFIHDEAIMQKPLLFSTSNARMLNSLNVGELNNQILSIPSIKEQEKIGKIINVTEFLIAANQDKINQLKQLKKLLMQKIFSQEWRFKGFTDPWEQRKLGDVTRIIGGGTPDSHNPQYWNGEVNWFTPTEIDGSHYVKFSKRKITKEGLKKSSAKLLPAGSVLLTSRATIGDMAIILKPSATNQGFQSIATNANISNEFIYAMEPKIKAYALKHAAGSTFLEISSHEVKNMKIPFPSYDEQSKLGDLSVTIGNLIAANQKKVDQLKQLKKYLMQNMFV